MQHFGNAPKGAKDYSSSFSTIQSRAYGTKHLIINKNIKLFPFHGILYSAFYSFANALGATALIWLLAFSAYFVKFSLNNKAKRLAFLS